MTDVMDEAQAEEVLLDEDAEATGHSFWDLGDLQVGLPADPAALVLAHGAAWVLSCNMRLASSSGWHHQAHW